ncbi:MAG: hypothetical protein WCK81_03230 [Betaproteobacteria bacterium]
MSSLALTDALLALVALWLASRAQAPVALRLACALFATASVLGVLRFSGVYPLPSWHQFASMLGAVAAFPLLAVAIVWPDALVTRSQRFAWIFLCLMAVLGVIVVGAGQKRLLADALALLSVLTILLTLLRQRQWRGALASAVMLLGLALFASKVGAGDVLVPGDLLHIGMALGLVGLGTLARWPQHSGVSTYDHGAPVV